jgi:hypothetical protein
VNWLGCQGPGPNCFPYVANRCRERLPLYDCPWHGLHADVSTFDLILRWDGRVEARYIQLPATPCLD